MASPGKAGASSPIGSGTLVNRDRVRQKLLSEGKGNPIDVPQHGATYTGNSPDYESQRRLRQARQVRHAPSRTGIATSSPYHLGRDSFDTRKKAGETSSAAGQKDRPVPSSTFYSGGRGNGRPRNTMKDPAWSQSPSQHRNAALTPRDAKQANRSQQVPKDETPIDLVSDDEVAEIEEREQPHSPRVLAQPKQQLEAPASDLGRANGKGKERTVLDMAPDTGTDEHDLQLSPRKSERAFTVVRPGDEPKKTRVVSRMKGKDPGSGKTTMEKKGGAPKGSKASLLGDPVSSSLRESRRSEGIYIEMRLSNIIFSEDQNIGSPSGAKEELIDSETFPRACITSESVTLSWDDVDVLSIALKNIEKMELFCSSKTERGESLFVVVTKVNACKIHKAQRRRLKTEAPQAFACFLHGPDPRENADKLRKLGHVELPFTVTTLDLNAATALRSTLTFLQGDTEVESNSSDSLSQTGQSRPLLGHQKRSLERSSPSPQRSAKILANESPHAKRIKSVSSSQQHASDGSQSPPRATNGSADGRARNLDERETIPPRTEEKHTVAKAEDAEATQPKTTSALPKKFEKSFSYPFEGVGAINVFESDLEKLEEGEFLNDTLIELGLKYLLEDIKKRDPALYDSIYVFSSFFWKRFTELGKERRQSYELVKKWTAKVDIFSKKYLVIPINENLHWYLAIVINPHYILRKRQVGDKDKGKVEDEVTEVKEPGIATSTANERRLQNRPEHHLQGMDEVWTTPSDGMTTPPLDTLQGSLGQEAEIDGGGNEIDGDVTMNEADTEAEVEAADAMEVDDAVEVHKVEVKPSHRTVTTWDDVLPTVVSSTPTSPNASLKEVPVQDKRTRARASRSGPSDGLHNAGQGTMLGGGGGHSTSTPINAGDTIRRLREEDDAKERMEQEQRARAREAEEEREREAKVRGISSSFPIQATYGDQGRAQLERKKSTGPKNPVVTERLRFNVENYTMILTFDSLGNSHKGVRTILRDYLCYEAQDKRQASFEDPKDIGDSLEQIQVACPAQDNYCDCGLFLLHFFERFFHDPRHMLDNVIIPRAKDHDSWAEEGTRTARKVWKERAKLIKQDFNERREKRCKEIRLAGQRNAEMSRSSSSLSPSAARSLSPSKALSPTESSSPLKARSVSKASPPAA